MFIKIKINYEKFFKSDLINNLSDQELMPEKIQKILENYQIN